MQLIDTPVRQGTQKGPTAADGARYTIGEVERNFEKDAP